MPNRETPRPGQEWTLSVDVAPPSRMVVARVSADPCHLVPCPIPHGALGRGGRRGGPRRGLGREWAFPPCGATLLLEAACWRFELQRLFSTFRL